jgi:hypothetical protein
MVGVPLLWACEGCSTVVVRCSNEPDAPVCYHRVVNDTVEIVEAPAEETPEMREEGENLCLACRSKAP